MKNLKNVLLAAGLGILAMDLTGCASTNTSESTGQYLDSSVITAKVKAALLNAPNLDSTDISVTTYKGTVQLSGFVNSAAQVAQAGQVAQNVQGVQSVQNNLAVKPSMNNN